MRIHGSLRILDLKSTTSYGFKLQMINSLMGSWGIRLIAALAVKFKQQRLPSDCVDHYLIDQSVKRRFDNTPNTKEAPKTNLQYVSKLTEKVVFNQVYDHMVSNAIFPALQSSYRQFHSTETALIKVMNDILLKMNSQHVTMLILLDLSAAFDTVDHRILLGRLSDEVGILGTALNWFTSYLSDRSQRVSVHGVPSRPFDLNCGVPQGSCLGTLLLIIYASKLFKIVEHYVSVKSKLQHAPPPRAYPGHLTPLPSRGGGNLIMRVFQGVGNLIAIL